MEYMGTGVHEYENLDLRTPQPLLKLLTVSK